MYGSGWKLAISPQKFKKLPQKLQTFHIKCAQTQRKNFGPLRASGRVNIVTKGFGGFVGKIMGLPKRTEPGTSDIFHLKVTAKERITKPYGLEETWERTYSQKGGPTINSFKTFIHFNPDTNHLVEIAPIRFTPFYLKIGTIMKTIPDDITLNTPIEGYQNIGDSYSILLSRNSSFSIRIPKFFSPKTLATVIGTPLGQKMEITFDLPLIGNIFHLHGEITSYQYPDEGEIRNDDEDIENYKKE